MTDERIKEFAIKAGLPMCTCGCDMPTRQVGTFARLLLEEFESFFTVLPQESAQTEENFVQKSVDEFDPNNDMKFTTAWSLNAAGDNT